MPIVAVGAFIMAMITLAWLLETRDHDQQRAALARGAQWAEQTLRLHMQSDQEFLQALARETSDAQFDRTQFRAKAAQYMVTNPHVSSITWVDAEKTVRDAVPPASGEGGAGDSFARPEQVQGFIAVRNSVQPVYGNTYAGEGHGPTFELLVPVRHGSDFLGAMVAAYPVSGIVRYLVPALFLERYHLSLTDAGKQLLAENSATRPRDEDLNYSLNIDPPGNGMHMQVTAYRAGTQLVKTLTIALIAGLSMLVVWSLWSLRNNLVRRVRAEDALRAEYSFRNAMEESMPTGMRAVDMDGHITYVNAAFCKMVGYAQEDLIGATAPFPYWGPQQLAEHERR
ncbi:MAG: PAS domain S-box protein, partial [Pseudomonadota bacterium]